MRSTILIFAATTLLTIAATARAEEASLQGADADQFIATLEGGGVDTDAEHSVDLGKELRLTRIDCEHRYHVGDDAGFSCDILYSDRLSEDGAHYKTVSLDPPAAAKIYQTLKDLFGVKIEGPEGVTGAQQVSCLKPSVGGDTSCKLNRLMQPRG